MSLGQNEYYVRPVNGSDVAGQGTSHATAYQTLNFAVNDIASTHGQNAGSLADRINICDEGQVTVTASLSWTSNLLGRTYEGYTSVAGDGGIADIYMGVGGAAYQFQGRNYTYFRNLDISGGLNPLQINTGWADNVKIHDTSSGCIGMGASSFLMNCEAYNISNYYVSATSGNVSIVGCKFWRGTGSGITSDGITLGNNSRVAHTLVDIGNGGNFAIKCNSSVVFVENCSLIARSPTGTNGAVRASSVTTHVNNCLIQGWSGTGQVAVQTSSAQYNIASVTNSAFYDNDSDYVANSVSSDAGNEFLNASLFVDLANDDFTPADIGNLRNGASGALNNSKGAVQLSAGGGGGPTVTPHPLSNAFHPLGQ